jgi:hypothetical protein
MSRPASVSRALALIWALVAMLVVMTVLAVVFADDLVAATGMGGARTADDTRVSPSFTPVVVTMVVCLGTTTLVFLSFFKGGHNWARHCLAALMATAAIATLAALRTGPPTLFVIGAVVMLLLEAALVAFLYHPDTGRYVAVSRPGPPSDSATS